MSIWNRPFPSSPGPRYQNEVKCSAFDMEMIFHSHANKTHFHKKGCALGLILKARVLELGRGLFMCTSINQYTIVNVSRISCQNESEKIKFLPVNNGPFSSLPKSLF